MPGSLGHLSARFFQVLIARPLDPAERAVVESWLPAELSEIFFAQPRYDQRHGYEAGLSVVAADATPQVVVAAVMHDTGKRHARLGIVGRVVASVLIKLGIPLTARMKLYRDHGITAAAEMAALGGPGIAVDYALHHHGDRPPSIPADTWELLVDADRANAIYGRRAGISSEDT